MEKIKRAVCFAILLLSINSVAQTDSLSSKKEKFRLGLSAYGSLLYGLLGDGYLGLSVTLQKTRHLIALGPIVRYDPDYTDKGTELCYQYYPKTYKKTFNFYLFANSFFSKHQFTTYYSGLHLIPYYYKATEVTIRGASGVGIRVNFAKWIYLYEQNGIGFNNTKITPNESSLKYYEETCNYSFFQIHVGLGFVF